MSFRIYLPRDILKPFVRSFAVSENEVAGTYKVLPGTSIVMGFQYSGSLSYLEHDNTVALSTAGITGLMGKYRTFKNSENTGTILVMFTETGAGAFFPQSMHELFGGSYALDDLILKSQMDIVVDQLREATTDTERITVVEDFLVSRLNHYAADELVNMAVALINQHMGNIKISSLAAKLFLSQGRLEKRFRKAVGASPKKYASIVRLKSLLEIPAKKDIMTQVGLDAGYYDQAHFIKDFKLFTGLTPQEYFK